MSTTHNATPRRRAEASPKRRALYAVLLIAVVLPVLWVVFPPAWGPVLAVVLLVAGGLLFLPRSS